MRHPPEPSNVSPAMGLRVAGPLKLLGDVSTVLGIKTRISARNWHWLIIGTLVFPLPLFYMLNAYVADDPSAQIRIIAGTLVFSVSFSTANQTSQVLLSERFMGTLKLMITAPVSKFAYVAGVLVHSSMIGAGSAAAILIFAAASGIDMSLTWTSLPVIVLAVLFLSGLTLFITGFATSYMVGALLANIAGIILAMVSPVFFTHRTGSAAPAVARLHLSAEICGRRPLGFAHRPDRCGGRDRCACSIHVCRHHPGTVEAPLEGEVGEPNKFMSQALLRHRERTRRLVLVRHSMPEIERDRPASSWRLGEIGRRRSELLARQGSAVLSQRWSGRAESRRRSKPPRWSPTGWAFPSEPWMDWRNITGAESPTSLHGRSSRPGKASRGQCIQSALPRYECILCPSNGRENKAREGQEAAKIDGTSVPICHVSGRIKPTLDIVVKIV